MQWSEKHPGAAAEFFLWYDVTTTPPQSPPSYWSILLYYYVIKHLMTLNCDQHSCKIQPQENNCSHPPPPHLPTIGLLTEPPTFNFKSDWKNKHTSSYNCFTQNRWIFKQTISKISREKVDICLFSCLSNNYLNDNMGEQLKSNSLGWYLYCDTDTVQ